ncbi:hypothetical protein F4803DRAFT_556163 [Xylaria telfairii]|nr:hypothetical protein F4803DRAFT_556163 [Xylaria telfairii]
MLFAKITPHATLIVHDLPNNWALNHIEIPAERVVDSRDLVAQVCENLGIKPPSCLGLKELCVGLMKICIIHQMGYHDALEEALATRELVLWCLTHPDDLKERGANVRAEDRASKEIRQKPRTVWVAKPTKKM